MEIKCKCNAPLLKSYGSTVKLRSKSIRWDTIGDTAVVQCNMCRAFNDVPLTLRIEHGNIVLELGSEVRKSTKECLVVPSDKKSAKNNDKQQ